MPRTLDSRYSPGGKKLHDVVNSYHKRSLRSGIFNNTGGKRGAVKQKTLPYLGEPAKNKNLSN